MNVYDLAHQLARSLANSEEYLSYQLAREKVDQRPQNWTMIRDLRQLQWEVNLAAMSGQEPDQQTMDRLQKIEAMARLNPPASAFLEAEFRVLRMIGDVQQILSQAVTLDLPEEVDDNQAPGV